ncbi:hypothetical protein GCM10027271_22980 [Saccharopolyspora gloriosae]|uniref:GNAT superfamily N-acetyltransferase n=1 Tax=Saccharopolyspora gloriosae TaxID=455344 RepID=A0A840NF04_9PSEU|nr:GNAT family N-acetyltransferase [Saccharopolyspora gloriosae]MBB5070966.1 GNAT superfamily N-acetyltransferase [Saccharopolyspora gloriosae]
MPTPDSTAPHCPPELLQGAKKVSVRPGFTGLLWTDVRARLSEPARQYLRRTFPAVAVRTFTGTDEAYWQEWLTDEKLDQLSGLVIALDGDGVPAGWVAGNDREFGGRTCFYANSAGVHPDHQGTGISSTLWRALLRAAIAKAAPRSLHAVMRTANPLVYSGWSAATGRDDTTWPAPGREIPEHVRRIAADAAADLGQADRLDPATSVITDAYESELWTERPTSHRAELDEWFAELLGPRDAVLLVVAFHPVSLMTHLVLHQVRRSLGLRKSTSSRSART